MLKEDLVIYHVRDHLVADGWEIVSLAILNKCGTNEVAVYAGIRLELEVRKGALSRLHAVTRKNSIQSLVPLRAPPYQRENGRRYRP